MAFATMHSLGVDITPDAFYELVALAQLAREAQPMLAKAHIEEPAGRKAWLRRYAKVVRK